MKIIINILFIAFFVTTRIQAQDITVLNGYKYIYLAPLEYQGGQSDRWGMRKMVREYFIKSGFKLIESQDYKSNIDPCDVATCGISHTANFYQSTSDYVTVTIVNCKNEKIFESVGKTGTLVVSFQQGYNKATRQAMQKFDRFRYTYDEGKSYWKLELINLPPVEIVKETETSLREYLSESKIDLIEGIYKTYHGNPTYRIG